MGWQDVVALAVVLGALLHLLRLARRTLFGGKSHCAKGCGKLSSNRSNVVARLQRAPRAVAPIGPILTIAPPSKKGGSSGVR